MTYYTQEYCTEKKTLDMTDNVLSKRNHIQKNNHSGILFKQS